MASSMSSASAGKLACVKKGTQRGGGYLTEFYTERLRPEVQPRTFYIPDSFERRGNPFVNLLLTNGTPVTFQV